MNSSDIQIAIWRNRNRKSNYIMPNIYINRFERDMFEIMHSGYTIDWEIKISVADYKADFINKAKKHELLNAGLDVNRFNIVCPEQVASEIQVPKEYGLWVYKRGSLPIKCVQSPKLLHKRKADKSIYYKCFSSIYYRYLHQYMLQKSAEKWENKS